MLVEENKRAASLGALWTEMNTILRRIRRRSSGEPSPRELVRINELKAQMKLLDAAEISVKVES